VLDPALLRPGRFDRQVVVPNPDVSGREKIIRVHMKNVPLAADVDVKTLARGTPGFSGAALANLVNEAALVATRRGAEATTLEDFNQAIERIIAVAQVHQRLYTTDDVQFVQLRPYISQVLTDHQITADVQGCSLNVEVIEARLDTDRAISLGIVVTELVTNALRHAYPNHSGPIRVQLSECDEANFQLVVEDEGIGLPLERKSPSIGSRIVDGMAKRLGSKLETEPRTTGTRFVLKFPKSNAVAAET